MEYNFYLEKDDVKVDAYKTKYIIGEVLDNDTQIRSKELGYIVGRECYIVLLEKGECMLLEYTDNRGAFKSTTVEYIDQTDYGFWVNTKNRTYRFDTEGFYK